MKIKHILTNNTEYCLEYFEIYCIKRGISYVKVGNEIHFGNCILFFHNKTEVKLKMIEKYLGLCEIHKNEKMVSRRVPNVRMGLQEIRLEPFKEEKKEVIKCSYPPYKEKMNNINTTGYPNKRIRKRF